MLGTTNAGPLATVDERGLVRGFDASWGLEWWVGADDRWHRPEVETAVRQRLVDATPVAETAMRVPGGDAVARAYGARVAGADTDVVAVDIANETSIPFAVAVVLTGHPRVRIDGSRVVIDDGVVVEFGREPSRWAASDDAQALHDLVVGGRAGTEPQTSPTRAVALIFPLVHTARLQVTIRVAGRGETASTSGSTPPSTVMPDAEQVARGWRAHIDRGLRLRLPHDSLTARINEARAALLLSAGGGLDRLAVDDLAVLGDALAREGLVDEADDVVLALAGRQRLNGRFGRGAAGRTSTALALVAFGAHWRCIRDRVLADDLVGPVAKAAHRIGKGATDDPALASRALRAAVELLDGADQPEAAENVRGLPAFAPSTAAGAPTALDDLAVRGPGAAGFIGVPASFLEQVRAGVVDDGDQGHGAELRLLGGFPVPWLGQAVEVDDAPTSFGMLSCALRWHGERPALLWERRPRPDEDLVPVRITAPALDPSWSSSDAAGEALLAAPAPPDPEASFS